MKQSTINEIQKKSIFLNYNQILLYKYPMSIPNHKIIKQKSISQSRYPIQVSEIINAHKIIYDKHNIVENTQLVKSPQLSQKYKANIYLKRQDQQKGRTFKIRGSYYKIKKATQQQKKKGFVCPSDGNFAQSLAILAGIFKFKAILFLPRVCNKSKIQKMKNFGGEYIQIKMEGSYFEQVCDKAKKFAAQNQMVFVHPFDDIDVITGYATMGLELLEDCIGDIDYIMVPSGGGGLAAAIGCYFKQTSPKTQIIAVQPENANPMYLSVTKNSLVSVEASRYCDGSSVKVVGVIPFEICKQAIDQYLTVSEGNISQTIISLYTQGIIAEPSGALAVAALDNIKDKIIGKNVICIISGSNTDLSRLDEAKQKSLMFKGNKNYYLLHLPNRSGIVAEILNHCLLQTDTVTSFQYKKKSYKQDSQALLAIQSKNQKDSSYTIQKLNEMNIKFENINLKSQILDLFF